MISYQNPDFGVDIHGSGKREKTDYIIQKVIQALNILEQFRDDVDELSVTELSKRLGMNEVSVGMLLATLKSRNYIEQNRSTNGYRLGFKNLELAQNLLRQTDLYRISHPVLLSLAESCRETCAVAVLKKTHVIELDAVQCEHPVQVVPRVGVHLPVHCTAAGKMLISSETDEALDLLLSGVELQSYTPNTVTCPQELKLRLRQVREQGYAIDDEELDRDVRSVSAAIRDYAGRMVGAVVITGPSCRIAYERFADELVPLVLKGANDISARLGYRETEPKGVAAAGGSRAAARKRR